MSWQRAIKLIWEDAVDIVKNDETGRMLHSPSLEMPLPRVVRAKNYVAKSLFRSVQLTRKNIAIRDNNECQYCGKHLSNAEQTLDHVTPASKGGKNTWQNLVVACKPCNHYKADNTPEQAGMILLKLPVKPKAGIINKYFMNVRPEWQDWA